MNKIEDLEDLAVLTSSVQNVSKASVPASQMIVGVCSTVIPKLNVARP